MSSLIVPSYTGQTQQQKIDQVVKAPPGDGPKAMPPNPYPLEPGEEWLPPAVQTTDIFTAQQTWPL